MKKRIPTLDKFVNERNYAGNKVYIEKFAKNELQLWYAYSHGSGTTIQLRDDLTYITDKSEDKNFNYETADMIETIRKDYKTIYKAQNSTLHKIPVYQYQITSQFNKYDIWGGEIEPSEYHYLVATSGFINVITYFKSKNEGRNWIKSMKD